MTATANSVGESYWFRQPSALFRAPSVPQGAACDEPPTAASRLRNAFVPDGTLGWTSAPNVNRLTRIALIVAVLLSIILRSWWPIAIGAGGASLVLLIAYGLQVQQDRERRRQRAMAAERGDSEPLLSLNTDSVGDEAFPVHDVLSEHSVDANGETGAASVFFPPEFPPSADERHQRAADSLRTNGAADENGAWATSSYVPNEFNPRTNAAECDQYPQCGPGGPQACASACSDPRADIPNPSRHNRYEKVDARYNLSAMQPQPVTVVDNGALLADRDSASHNHPLAKSGAPSATFGIDPRSASVAQLTGNYQRPQSLSATYMAPLRSSNSQEMAPLRSSNSPKMAPLRNSAEMATQRSSEAAGPTMEQTRTQTDRMLQKMYMDKNEYFWDEMVAQRAPDWRQNPNDPRNRLALQQKEIERQSYRGLQWSQGA